MRIRILFAFLTVAFAAALPLPAHANRFNDFVKLRDQGKLEEALKVLREEIVDPMRTNDPAKHGTSIRQHFLLSLGTHAARVGASPQLDAEAKKVYDEGIVKFAHVNPEHAAILANGMGLYFSSSYRNGLAVPYFRRELEHWQRTSNRFRLMLAYDAIAGAYWDTGEFELSRLYLAKVLDAASGHFALGQRPTDLNEWLQYWTILGKHMDNAAQVGDAALLDKLWALQEPIEPRYWGNGALTGFTAAQYFAFAGQNERARATLARSIELWKTFKGRDSNERLRRLGEQAQLCTQGMVAVALKEYAAATPHLEQCLKVQAELGVKENEANFKQKLGAAHEGSGNPGRAIALYRESIASAEGTRSSYSIAERAKFFRSFMRLAYWGLVRVQAGRAAAGDESAFFEAMHVSELTRGRQLGELIDPEMSSRISPASLKALQQRLPEDAVVLAYTATDSEIVLLGIARERVLAAVTPYDGKAYAALARGIARNLADPKSNSAQLDARLLEMSRPVLAAARPLLAGKKRIIALPDGIMNTVPFDLLSAADDAYRPLISEFTVAASPSLVFIQYAEGLRASRGAANLMALADPRYGKPNALAGASVQEVQEATRGSRFLSYFDPLPETRTEVEAISKMFGGQKVELLLGDQATESQIKRLDLSQFGFLHFATHGVLGGEVPGIGEPALVLAEEANEDGFLTSTEVGRLKINADLTVLSACNTGSGEFVTGEGVMGMSRAFLAAGSRSVVVSLWPVASKQTERLMVDFYRNLRAGQPAADALRAAKLDMAGQARKAGSLEDHPFFWAAFILLGG